MNKPVSQILTEARDLIKNGWAQGIMYEIKFVGDTFVPCYCSIGAIHKAAAGTPFPDSQDMSGSQLLTAKKYLNIAIGEEWAITTWNDSSDMTKEIVIETFKNAIALAEADNN